MEAKARSSVSRARVQAVTSPSTCTGSGANGLDQTPVTLCGPLIILVLFLAIAGPYHQARRLAADTFARCRRVLGDDDPDTLLAAHHLGVCLYAMGAFEQSRQLDADTLARRRRVLGDDHMDVHRTAHILGCTLREVGEVEEARRLHGNCLAYARRVLGDDSPDAIYSANDLGRDLHEVRPG
jgi:hypothetical protein